jgi:alpha-ribazole phosphatase
VSEPFLLHLMRHGEPALAGRMLGRTDSPATPAGIAACVDQAAGLAVDHILSSDLRRASACAAAIAREGLGVIGDPRWRELDFGAWDGLAPAEIDSGALERFWHDPDTAPPPGGERWSELLVRVGSAIADLPGGPTLVVTHGGAIRASLAILCGFTLPQLWAFDLPYTAVLSLRVWPGTSASAQIMGLWT